MATEKFRLDAAEFTFQASEDLSKYVLEHPNVATFKSILLSISDVLSSAGYDAVPFFSDNLTDFEKLSDANKRMSCKEAWTYLRCLKEEASQCEFKEASKVSLWRALKIMNLVPTSDLFNYIDDKKIIELYDHRSIQCWRSFSFFQVCSYSLEQVFCYPWMERYKRNEFIMKRLLSFIETLATGPAETVRVGVENIAEETQSYDKLKIRCFHEYASPLYSRLDDGTKIFSGYVVISDAELVQDASLTL